ncbi:uncharacterized protein A4U43_C06F770 [Asparagus officinalis]|uniref:MSP domain-containing protein n=1 Tax=Asparagus officinalis TaxID=4686 RepID=A0A5P1EKP5_ASPOF|nr:uncharacterized protein A4U43_C06F770 [Asparagus officinalis]
MVTKTNPSRPICGTSPSCPMCLDVSPHTPFATVACADAVVAVVVGRCYPPLSVLGFRRPSFPHRASVVAASLVVATLSPAEKRVTMASRRVELKKQIPCSIFISNKTDDHIALKLTSTNWVDYRIRPSMAILLPRSTREVIVLMEDQRKAPRNMRCDFSLTVNAVVTFAGATVKDVAHNMFFRESGNTVDKVELKAIYVSPPKLPSPVPERCDKRSLYWASATATLQKFYNGLARRRMWKSCTKINFDSNLIREPLLVSSSNQTGG